MLTDKREAGLSILAQLPTQNAGLLLFTSENKSTNYQQKVSANDQNYISGKNTFFFVDKTNRSYGVHGKTFPLIELLTLKNGEVPIL